MAERICSIEGCSSTVANRGMCQRHYNAWRRAIAASACRVDGCPKPAGVPGTAKGYCSGHYQRLKKYGDPLGCHVPTVGTPCTVDGCEHPIKARGWCGAHLSAWQRHGDPLYRRRGEVVNGCRICPECGEDKPLDQWSANRTYCRPCAAKRMRNRRQADPVAAARARRRQYETDPERHRERRRRWREANPERARAESRRNTQLRRAALLGVDAEVFDDIEIFERDDWLCGICGTAIAPERTYPDPHSVSLDHVLPLARGGAHTRSNVQAAHLQCNLRKHCNEAPLVGAVVGRGGRRRKEHRTDN